MIKTTLIAVSIAVLSACAAPWTPDFGLEDIYVLRSIREPQAPSADWCAPSRTGFAPFPQDAERFFSFWSVRSRPEDGKVVDARQARVADLRACFGPTDDRARQNFYAEVRLFPVRCQLVLSGLPAPFVGGLLTTNTMTTRAPFGGETQPPGYTQASIATIRLWRARPSH